MDLRNDPRFFNWRRDWWQIAFALAWVTAGYFIFSHIAA